MEIEDLEETSSQTSEQYSSYHSDDNLQSTSVDVSLEKEEEENNLGDDVNAFIAELINLVDVSDDEINSFKDPALHESEFLDSDKKIKEEFVENEGVVAITSKCDDKPVTEINKVFVENAGHDMKYKQFYDDISKEINENEDPQQVSVKDKKSTETINDGASGSETNSIVKSTKIDDVNHYLSLSESSKPKTSSKSFDQLGSLQMNQIHLLQRTSNEQVVENKSKIEPTISCEEAFLNTNLDCISAKQIIENKLQESDTDPICSVSKKRFETKPILTIENDIMGIQHKKNYGDVVSTIEIRHTKKLVERKASSENKSYSQCPEVHETIDIKTDTYNESKNNVNNKCITRKDTFSVFKANVEGEITQTQVEQIKKLKIRESNANISVEDDFPVNAPKESTQYFEDNKISDTEESSIEKHSNSKKPDYIMENGALLSQENVAPTSSIQEDKMASEQRNAQTIKPIPEKQYVTANEINSTETGTTQTCNKGLKMNDEVDINTLTSEIARPIQELKRAQSMTKDLSENLIEMKEVPISAQTDNRKDASVNYFTSCKLQPPGCGEAIISTDFFETSIVMSTLPKFVKMYVLFKAKEIKEIEQFTGAKIQEKTTDCSESEESYLTLLVKGKSAKSLTLATSLVNQLIKEGDEINAALSAKDCIVLDDEENETCGQMEEEYVISGKARPYFNRVCEINHLPTHVRICLRMSETLSKIRDFSGATISVRGIYMSSNELDNLKWNSKKPLHLFIEGPNKESLDFAVNLISVIIKEVEAPKKLQNELPSKMGKVVVALEDVPPSFDLLGRLLGPNNCNIDCLQAATGTEIQLLGKGSPALYPDLTKSPLHFFIKSKCEESLKKAITVLEDWVKIVREEIEDFKILTSGLALFQYPPSSSGLSPETQASCYQYTISLPMKSKLRSLFSISNPSTTISTNLPPQPEFKEKSKQATSPPPTVKPQSNCATLLSTSSNLFEHDTFSEKVSKVVPPPNDSESNSKNTVLLKDRKEPLVKTQKYLEESIQAYQTMSQPVGLKMQKEIKTSPLFNYLKNSAQEKVALSQSLSSSANSSTLITEKKKEFSGKFQFVFGKKKNSLVNKEVIVEKSAPATSSTNLFEKTRVRSPETVRARTPETIKTRSFSGNIRGRSPRTVKSPVTIEIRPSERSRVRNKRSRSISRKRSTTEYRSSRSTDERSTSRDRRSRSRDRRSRSRDRRSSTDKRRTVRKRSRSRDKSLRSRKKQVGTTSRERTKFTINRRSRSRDRLVTRKRKRSQSRSRRRRSKSGSWGRLFNKAGIPQKRSKSSDRRSNSDITTCSSDKPRAMQRPSEVNLMFEENETEKSTSNDESVDDPGAVQDLRVSVDKLKSLIDDQVKRYPPGAGRQKLVKICQYLSKLSSVHNSDEYHKNLSSELPLMKQILLNYTSSDHLTPILEAIKNKSSNIATPTEKFQKSFQIGFDVGISKNKMRVKEEENIENEFKNLANTSHALGSPYSKVKTESWLEGTLEKEFITPEIHSSLKHEKNISLQNNIAGNLIGKSEEKKKTRPVLSTVMLQLHEDISLFIKTLKDGFKKSQLQQILTMIETAPLALVLNESQRTELKAILLLLRQTLKSEISLAEPSSLVGNIQLFEDLVNNVTDINSVAVEKLENIDQEINSNSSTDEERNITEQVPLNLKSESSQWKKSMHIFDISGNLSAQTLFEEKQPETSFSNVPEKIKKEHLKLLEVIKMLQVTLSNQAKMVHSKQVQSQVQQISGLLHYILQQHKGNVIEEKDLIQFTMIMQVLETVIQNESAQETSTSLPLMKPIISNIRENLEKLKNKNSSDDVNPPKVVPLSESPNSYGQFTTTNSENPQTPIKSRNILNNSSLSCRKALEVIKLLQEALSNQVLRIQSRQTQAQIQKISELMDLILKQSEETFEEKNLIQLIAIMQVLETVINESPQMADCKLPLLKPIISNIQNHLAKLKDELKSPTKCTQITSTLSSSISIGTSSSSEPTSTLRIPQMSTSFTNVQETNPATPSGALRISDTPPLKALGPSGVSGLQKDNSQSSLKERQQGTPTNPVKEVVKDASFNKSTVVYRNKFYRVVLIPESTNIFASFTYFFNKPSAAKLSKGMKDLQWKTIRFIRLNRDMFFSKMTAIYNKNFPKHDLTPEMAFEKCCLYIPFLANSQDSESWKDIAQIISTVYNTIITIMCEDKKKITVEPLFATVKKPISLFRKSDGSFLPIVSENSLLVATWNVKHRLQDNTVGNIPDYIDECLSINNIGIVCLQSVGSCLDQRSTSNYIWKSTATKSSHQGVTILIHKHSNVKLIQFTRHSDCVASADVSFNDQSFRIIGCDMTGSENRLHDHLTTVAMVLKEIPEGSEIIILGDFDASIGSVSESDPIQNLIGRRTLHNQSNINGETLKKFAVHFGLRIETTFLKNSEVKALPRQKMNDQFSHILVRPSKAEKNIRFCWTEKLPKIIVACKLSFDPIEVKCPEAKTYCFASWHVADLSTAVHVNQVEQRLVTSNVAFACIQFSGRCFIKNSMKSKNFAWYFCQDPDKISLRNVAFLLRQGVEHSLNGFTAVNQHIAAAKLKVDNILYAVVGCYLPTGEEAFQEEAARLLSLVNHPHPTARLVVMGEFYAEIGHRDLNSSEAELIPKSGLIHEHCNFQGKFLKKLALLHNLYLYSTLKKPSSSNVLTNHCLFEKGHKLQGKIQTKLNAVKLSKNPVFTLEIPSESVYS